jgi:hypothetical protein
MSARSSSDILPLVGDKALLGHEGYHQPGTLLPRRNGWTRLLRLIPSLKWLVIFGTQMLLLYQLHETRHSPVRNGDEINGFAPKRSLPMYIPFWLDSTWLTAGAVSTQITYPHNEMDFYISNYTSDEDMVTIRQRWENLVPSKFLYGKIMSWEPPC